MQCERKTRAGFCILLGLTVFANLAIAQSKPKWDCDGGSQLDLNYCAGDRFKNVDKELNVLYQRPLDSLKREENRNSFRDAQRAWLVFRDKSCLYEVGPRDIASMWPMEQSNCLTSFTKKRIEEIKGYLACSKDGCPN